MAEFLFFFRNMKTKHEKRQIVLMLQKPGGQLCVHMSEVDDVCSFNTLRSLLRFSRTSSYISQIQSAYST
jgi:hypothetical protein